MEEEGLLLASPSSSSPSLLSGISNVSTRPFVLAFTVCSCGAFVSGCVSGYSAPTQSGIMKDLNLSVADYSLFGSILTVGIILGALICGKLTDLVGRINTMWIINVFFISGWFSIAFAKISNRSLFFNPKVIWMLDMGRLLHGIGIGISAYLGPIYMTEITPRNLRGAVSSCSQLFAIVGSSLFYALGTVVGWRDLAILGAIPFLVIIPLLFFIPESPRWLAKVGREKEVKAVLLSLRGAESDISNEAQEILDYTEHVKQQEDGDSGFFKLFQRKYAFSLTIGVALIALPELGGNSGYSYYTDSIFTRTGFSSWIILGMPCHSHFFLLAGGTSILALISVLVYFASYGLAMSSIPWIVASEIYPVDVKGAAGTVCNLAGSISSCLVAYSFNFLLQWSSTGTFLMFATVTGLGFVFIAKLVPETKGKSLEEIQSLFTDPPLKNSTS
ncbi:PREDICTED: sugar transporter ERD6-like 15 isoform X5 [Brassica oleracea var. oleracea]|uniref:sugar transporter ERD6-like 15 isoform X5 n=1 Tax=Brassica oleracea var. oleracea TaxID=109376 RepID=UPI0006A705A5|nr:PREDICTED: sugar transporter ERD6-like 15 isoform X5 [Brassica oleracea var. oleracea]